MILFDTWWVGVIAALAGMTYWARRTQKPSYHSWSCLMWLSISIMLVRCFFWEVYTTAGPSMTPTIASHSTVVVNKQAYGWMMPVFHYRNTLVSARHNDIIAFQHNKDVWVKRVVGRPGDVVTFSTNGWFINGNLVAPDRGGSQWFEHGGFEVNTAASSISATHLQSQWDRQQMWELTIPRGFVFVLGDNPSQSTDSRHVGLVPMSDVVGRVDWFKRSTP